MKIFKVHIFILLLLTSSLFAQEERKVLVEIFTNSHCPLCPPAHNVINNYLAGSNGDKISYIFFHMLYPYPDDLLYMQSMEDSDSRDNYYDPIEGTPQAWFDGIHQGGSAGWSSTLDNLVGSQSPLKIILSGMIDNNNLNLSAEVTRNGDISDNDLVIHFVVVENLFYAGRNGVSNHKHVMRKMLPSPDGQIFSINLNETLNISQATGVDPIWNLDSLSVVVFVQSISSKTIYQSATISYNELNTTDLTNEVSSPKEFKLEQNYPNPFNPSTVIGYQLPVSGNVTLRVYDLLGREVTTLVSEEKQSGNHLVEFRATSLPNGVYFYKLQVGNLIETQKMILMK